MLPQRHGDTKKSIQNFVSLCLCGNLYFLTSRNVGDCDTKLSRGGSLYITLFLYIKKASGEIETMMRAKSVMTYYFDFFLEEDCFPNLHPAKI
jgi:hypothetical protein